MIRKRILAAAAALLLLTGCTGRKNTDTGMVNYEAYFHAVESNAKFEESSRYYTLSTEMNEMPDGTYRYYVIVDDPQIAMYEIKVLAVEKDATFEKSVKMMPSSGILDDAVSMIPGQVNSEGGFVKGIALSGECTEPQITLSVLVAWKDKNGQKETREFLTVTAAVEEAQAGS